MERILLLDAMDYDSELPEIKRVSVRGIIFVENKLLLIEDKFGEVKLPGGGKEGNETDIETLIREVSEETGYQVLPESIVEFGEIEEKRLSVKESMIWHQFNRLYFCKINKNQGTCNYSDNEKKYGFKQVWYTLEEAIYKNKVMLETEGKRSWNQREIKTLELIQQYLISMLSF